jgi:hypothetical protein
MTAEALAAEFGVEIVDWTIRPKHPLATRGGRTISKLIEEHGPGHARLVLSLVCETSAASRRAINAPVLRALSAIVVAHPDLGPDTLDRLDALDLGDLYRRSKTVRGIPRHHVLAAWLAVLLGLVELPSASQASEPDALSA